MGNGGAFIGFTTTAHTTTISTFSGAPPDCLNSPCEIVTLTHAPLPTDLSSTTNDVNGFLGLTSVPVLSLGPWIGPP